MNNACTELERAILILATSTRSLQDRLSEAWTKIDSYDLSSNHDTTEHIDSILKSMRQELRADGGTDADAFANMHDETCKRWIQQIVNVHSEALSSQH
jgi:hypothetical protein